MAIGNNDLILMTAAYPFGHGESFLETEILFLKEKFNKIYILPNSSQLTGKIRTIPTNCEVVPFVSISSSNKWKRMFSMLTANWFWKEMISRLNPFQFPHIFEQGMLAQSFFSKLEYFCKERRIEPKRTILYNYWLTLDSFASGLMHDKINFKKAITRAHRFDLYEELDVKGYQPFKNQLISKLDYVFPVSADGADYLLNKYSAATTKNVATRRLGVYVNRQMDLTIPTEILIVSCSGIRPVKRVDLIAQSLKELGKIEKRKPVKWVHIGDGEETIKSELVKITATFPKNISVDFLGNLKNKQVYQFYENNPIFLFINLSSSEGVPVSIMEAQSFSIPVLATTVGGVAEIINEENGFPVSEHTQANEIAKILKEIIDLPTQVYIQKRANSYKNCKEMYNADKNYKAFAKELIS